LVIFKTKYESSSFSLLINKLNTNMKNKETAHELKVLCRAIINKDISRPLLTAYAHSYLAISEQDYEDMAHRAWYNSEK
tara:strand:- start:247 stop:483 length:237 start_codon:yes stop_codon:yes gene_type:complete